MTSSARSADKKAAPPPSRWPSALGREIYGPTRPGQATPTARQSALEDGELAEVVQIIAAGHTGHHAVVLLSACGRGTGPRWLALPWLWTGAWDGNRVAGKSELPAKISGAQKASPARRPGACTAAAFSSARRTYLPSCSSITATVNASRHSSSILTSRPGSGRGPRPTPCGPSLLGSARSRRSSYNNGLHVGFHGRGGQSSDKGH